MNAIDLIPALQLIRTNEEKTIEVLKMYGEQIDKLWSGLNQLTEIVAELARKQTQGD